MKTFHKAPLALAIAALMMAPTAFANGEGNNGGGHNGGNGGGHNDGNGGFEASSSIDSTFMNAIDVDLSHSSDTRKNFRVNVRVNEDADYYSGALVDSKQFNDGNEVTYSASENNATVGSGAGVNATGNVGINVAAGDNNSQANDAALANNDAAAVFGQAEIYSAQHARGNTTTNIGSPNTAVLGNGSLSGASGNIGVNIAAGTSNAQQNSLAASNNEAGGHARATVGGVQQSAGNTTSRTALENEFTNTVSVDVEGTMTGSLDGIGGEYDGTWNQTNDVYPEIWSGDDSGTNHGQGSYWGHADFDDQGDAGQDGRFEGDEGGTFSFDELSEVSLSGTMSGSVESVNTVYIANQNNATMGSNSLQGASGNVGVNIAAGANNLQRNSLAIASSMAGNGGE